MNKDNKQPNEAMQRDWSMREIKETRYQELLKKEQRLEAIESAEGVEAINIINDKLKLEKTHRMSIIKWNELHTINNFILKSQQQAKELERYKKFVKSIEIDEEHNLTILNETELKKLVVANNE